MGPAIGIKNADPAMKVVIAGLVTGSDYVKGMVDWCKEFRGYKADGSVNFAGILLISTCTLIMFFFTKWNQHEELLRK